MVALAQAGQGLRGWVQVTPRGELIAQVRVSGKFRTTSRHVLLLADEFAREIRRQLAAMRYLAEPAGRWVTVRVMSPEGTLGPVVWRIRARPGDGVRLYYARIQNPDLVQVDLEAELLAALITGQSPMFPDLDLELVDTEDPNCVRRL